MPIGLEPVELEHLPQAPLKLALVQVVYRPVLAIESAEEMRRFAHELGVEWALVEQGAAQQVQFEFGPEGLRQQHRAPETVWRFEDPEGRFRLMVSRTSLGLESVAYRAFDEFGERMRGAVRALGASFDPITQTRLGVRYVNEIEDPRLADRAQLAHFVNADLVRPVGGALGSDLVASLSELRFAQPDGTFVLRHGLVAQDKYLLDFDYFVEGEDAYGEDAVISITEAFHGVIETVFCWSLGAGYLQELRGGGE